MRSLISGVVGGGPAGTTTVGALPKVPAGEGLATGAKCTGAALVVVDAISLGLSGLVTEADRARDVGKKVLEALHLPVQDDSRVVLTSGKSPEGAWHQIVVSSDGRVDRSPGGAAVAARVALMARDGLQPGVRVRFEGILGTGLEGWWEEEAGPGGAPRTVWVAGVPWITGYRRFFRDPDDAVMPFLVR